MAGIQKGVITKMVTIEAFAKIKGHVISWLFDGNNEGNAEANAKREFERKGLTYINRYVIVGELGIKG